VNENGNGSVAHAFTTNSNNGSLQPDPSCFSFPLDPPHPPCLPGPVLAYNAQTDADTVTDGDVVLVDLNWGGTVSHLIRFYHGNLIFYARDGTHSSADAGLPAWTSAVQIVNQGPSGTFWQPRAGQPGYIYGTVSYPVGEPFGYMIYASFPVSGGLTGGSSGALKIWGSSSSITLSWPKILTNYALCQGTNPVTTNWVVVTNTPTVVSNTINQVSIAPNSAYQFFRLQPQP
jgi:hypothetical protein